MDSDERTLDRERRAVAGPPRAGPTESKRALTMATTAGRRGDGLTPDLGSHDAQRLGRPSKAAVLETHRLVELARRTSSRPSWHRLDQHRRHQWAGATRAHGAARGRHPDRGAPISARSAPIDRVPVPCRPTSDRRRRLVSGSRLRRPDLGGGRTELGVGEHPRSARR
jgi:hypothetical protein